MNVQLRNWSGREDTKNWKSGSVGPFYFVAYIFHRPSESGIGGSNILQLTLSWEKECGLNNAVVDYCRGWYIKPETEMEKLAVEKLVSYFAYG